MKWKNTSVRVPPRPEPREIPAPSFPWRLLAVIASLALFLTLGSCSGSGGGGSGGGGGQPIPNQAPTANAGPDQSVNKNVTVTLDGSGSSDPEGATLSYSWQQTGGTTTVTLSNAAAASPTFTAPPIGDSLTFRLTVSDGALTASDTVTVTVVNQAPTASISADAAYNGGESVFLDGTGSSDPDGDVITYSWSGSCPNGGTIVFHDATSARPEFVVTNNTNASGAPCTVDLTVSDGEASTAATQATFTTLAYNGSTVSLTQNPFRTLTDNNAIVSLTDPQDITVSSGDDLYVADGSANLLRIFPDVSTTPITSSSTPTNYTTLNAAQAVVVSGTQAYVAISTTGLEIVDVTTPTSPSCLGSTTSTSCVAGGSTFSGFAVDVAVYSNTYALLVDSRDGEVVVYDFSTPSSISEVMTLSVPGASTIVVDSSFAYVGGSGGLTVFDLSNLGSSVTQIATYTSVKPVSSLAVDGLDVYMAVGDFGLEIVRADSSSRTSFTQQAVFDTVGRAIGVNFAASTIYVADNTGLQIIDVLSPTSPSLDGNYVVPGANAVFTDSSNGITYVAGTGNLFAFDFNATSPSLSSLQANVNIGGTARAVATLGDRLYLNRLAVYDISDPVAASSSDSLSPAGSGTGNEITLAGGYAFLAAGAGGLEILDIRHPGLLSVESQFTDVATANAVAIAGDTAYIGTDASGFMIVDVTTKSSPSLSGSTNIPPSINDIAVSGSFAFAADSSGSTGLVSLDVGVASSPQAKQTYSGTVYEVALSDDGNTGYLAMGVGGLDILDVSSPATALTALGNADSFFASTDDVRAVAASGNYAFAAVQPSDSSPLFNYGIVILDVTSSASPTLAGQYETTLSTVNRIAAEGDFIYVGADSDGLLVAERMPTIIRITTLTNGATATNTYGVNWTDPELDEGTVDVYCVDTLTTCTVDSINQTLKFASVTWDLTGAAPGSDEEILIAVGNQHYFNSIKDRVTVQ